MTTDGPLSFPDGPRGELDDALQNLIAQAERVRGAQGRLRSLLRAVQHVVGDIELSAVLRSVVEAATELAQAEYGALGVIDADGTHLDQFIFVGLGEREAAGIGHLPRGHGILGALITQPDPIRLPHLGRDRRSAGFPAHHPHMDSFLGVPVRVRGEVFGNLYLTNRKGGGSFTDEDEQLVQALAATAGFAIQNARLFEEARIRERWMTAAADLSAALLSTSLDQALDLIAGRVLDTAAAARVAIVVPLEDGAQMQVAAVRGEDEDSLHGRSLGAGSGTIALEVLEEGDPRIGRALDEASDDPLRVVTSGRSGSVVAVPLRSRQRSWGVLVVGRAPGQPEITDLDAEVLSSLAAQAAIALELARARTEQQRRMLSDERARIAQDLHDHVIQQLFAAGLTLQAVAGGMPDDRDRARLGDVSGQLDDAIGQIRTVIFALSAKGGNSVRHRIMDVVADLSMGTERPPAIRFSGPLDHVVEGPLADDCVAVVRELLSNSIRHAGSEEIALEVAVGEESLRVSVSDRGGGIVGDRRSGLANLAERAAARSGSFDVDTGPEGTRAVWRVPAGAGAR